ncbi:glycoside hydrolase family 31 protein [Halobacillus sp. Nhm2S1]|uniref:glycoside hydrolase family 31 protein n=1 Tax=Halobacillus sp. Nhm2S1 TaxID=2866716 RepID=UPI001C733548|nr:glycoside hydrolase family 31 protein [Halobacillus sp. Nhm2S1]MBX0356840.1 glycoside hydrolase family 31 protein [Halobacillus sp. Nhm2S1]
MIKNDVIKLVNHHNNVLKFESESMEEIKLFILEEQIFRVYIPYDKEVKLDKTWSIAPGMSDIPFEGRDRFDLTPFSLPSYEVEQNDYEVTIYTNSLKAVISLVGFKITWYVKEQGQWVKVTEDRQTQAYNANGNLGSDVFHYMVHGENDHYYGLGEKGGDLNKANRRVRMQAIDAMGYDAENTDPLYKHIPFYITFNPDHGKAYGILYDNYNDSEFDLGNEKDYYHGRFRSYRAKKGDLDYYFIAGQQIKDVVKTHTWLTGKMILPPKWSLGYSGSTMTYTDAPNAQEELKKFVENCKKFDIPCESFQLSSGYTSIEDKRYVFNWNTSKIPNPNEMVNHFHEHDIRLSANIKPCLLTGHPMYEELATREMFIKHGDEPDIIQYWDDLGSYLDFTNYETIQWWKDNVKKQLMRYGIDSTWNDNNEYQVLDEQAMANGFGESLPAHYIKPIETLLMMKASFEAQKEYHPNERPYLISRSGSPGMQRYVQTWSGDNFTEWKTIRFNQRMGLGLSLSGVYNFGHDVGGFAGGAPEPELFIRWIQNGIFHPRFTIHSWNEDGSVNVPWMYPEHVDEIRELMKERVRWIPYLYDLLHKAHNKYEPLLAPTLYHFQDDERTFEENDEMMVGSDLLLASVMDRHAKKRTLYLPQQPQGWYDINSDRWYEGGQSVTVDAPLNVIPKFAKGGAVFPIQDGEISFENKEESRGLLIFPTKGEGESYHTFTEDDGISMDYERDITSTIKVEMETTEEAVSIKISTSGSYELPYETINLHFPKSEKRSITVNNEPFSGGNIHITNK